jgi:hypothetical protein
MPEDKIYRQEPMAADFTEVLAKYRASVELAAELLKQPSPDTFLGRPTSMPFPKGDE